MNSFSCHQGNQIVNCTERIFMVIVTLHVSNKSSLSIKIWINLGSVGYYFIMMILIKSDDMLLNTYYMGSGYEQVDVYRGINIGYLWNKPHLVTAITESNDSAPIVFLQYHSTEESINITVNDNILI